MYILPCLCENVPCRSHHYGGTLQDQQKEMHLLRTYKLEELWADAPLVKYEYEE